MSFEFWAQTVCRQNTGTAIGWGHHHSKPPAKESDTDCGFYRTHDYLPVEVVPVDQLARLRAEGAYEDRGHIAISERFDAKPGDVVGVQAFVSLPHFLNTMLVPDARLQEEFDAFNETRPESEPWENVLDAFRQAKKFDATGGYTYNSDRNDLDQDFAYWVCESNDEEFVIVRTHNGRDARLGFTTPFFAKWRYSDSDERFYNWFAELVDDDGNDIVGYPYGVVGDNGEIARVCSSYDGREVFAYNPVMGW